MNVAIKSMGLTRGALRQDGMRMLAAFTATIGPIELHHCTIMQKPDGHLSVSTPFVKVARKNIYAIRVTDREIWDELVRAALAEYRKLVDAEPDVPRVLCAGEMEVLERAGI